MSHNDNHSKNSMTGTFISKIFYNMLLTLKKVKENLPSELLRQGLFLSILSQKVEDNLEHVQKQQKSDYFWSISHHQNWALQVFFWTNQKLLEHFSLRKTKIPYFSYNETNLSNFSVKIRNGRRNCFKSEVQVQILRFSHDLWGLDAYSKQIKK